MITGLRYALAEGWEQPPQGYKHRSVCDVAVDSRDRVYLYIRDGTFVTAWGRGRFPGPAHGLAIGPDDSVYCVNDGDHTVRKFTPGGELLMTLGTSGVPSDTGCKKREHYSWRSALQPAHQSCCRTEWRIVCLGWLWECAGPPLLGRRAVDAVMGGTRLRSRSVCSASWHSGGCRWARAGVRPGA